jgi:N6-adenosine-specific RNA methylase IME4
MLVSGRHRLEAARKLKQDSIRAEIREGMKADEAEIAEIDENLIRADLSPAERALHFGRRKELYVKLYPETEKGKAPADKTKGGKGGKLKSQNEKLTLDFTADTAKKTGKGRSTVARDVTRAENVVVLPDITGTSLDKGDEIDALAKLPEKDQRILAKAAQKGKKVSAKTRLKQIKRETREQELGAKQIALPTKQYGVIYADPPWRFEPYSRVTGMDRAPENHYPTEELAAIARMQIPAAEDCVLFLWATLPLLPEAIQIMSAWGFNYKSHFVWIKDKAGTGYWVRAKHELLLIGTRGNIPAPAPGDQYESAIAAPVGEHSAKPFVFHEMIEEMFPTLPKLEMFARGECFEGWDAWGNESQSETKAAEQWPAQPS